MIAVLMAAAAPARAWCEASCLATAHSTQDASGAHCPAHEPATSAPAMSGGAIGDCPVIEPARPATAKIEFVRAAEGLVWHLARRRLTTKALQHSVTHAPRHLSTIPLRV